MPVKRLTQSSALSTQHSTSPNGESFPLPKPEDYDREFRRLQKLAAKHRKEGREIVVVMGVGFVGAVMAGVIEYVAYPILKKAFERRFPSPAPSVLSTQHLVQTLMGFDDDIFKITPLAIDINDTRFFRSQEKIIAVQ